MATRCPSPYHGGQTGTTMNAVCMAALHHKFRAGSGDVSKDHEMRCFMHKQLGYLLNHKCHEDGLVCDTRDALGYSYIAGCAGPPFTCVFAAPHPMHAVSAALVYMLCCVWAAVMLQLAHM